MSHYYHFTVRRWILWTFIGGVLIGAYVLANLATWELSTPAHLRLALIVGAIFWALFGFVSWAADGVEIVRPNSSPNHASPSTPPHEEWEAKARVDAIRSRAVRETGESRNVI
jgi:hypothetical protein